MFARLIFGLVLGLLMYVPRPVPRPEAGPPTPPPGGNDGDGPIKKLPYFPDDDQPKIEKLPYFPDGDGPRIERAPHHRDRRDPGFERGPINPDAWDDCFPMPGDDRGKRPITPPVGPPGHDGEWPPSAPGADRELPPTAPPGHEGDWPPTGRTLRERLFGLIEGLDRRIKEDGIVLARTGAAEVSKAAEARRGAQDV